jgi:hypothetical protein
MCSVSASPCAYVRVSAHAFREGPSVRKCALARVSSAAGRRGQDPPPSSSETLAPIARLRDPREALRSATAEQRRRGPAGTRRVLPRQATPVWTRVGWPQVAQRKVAK